MPEMQLREFLTRIEKKEKIPNHKYIYKSTLAWNSFITGKPTRLAYREDASVPKLEGIILNNKNNSK